MDCSGYGWADRNGVGVTMEEEQGEDGDGEGVAGMTVAGDVDFGKSSSFGMVHATG